MSAVFPAAVATDADLKVAANRISSPLLSPVTIPDSAIAVVSGTGFAVNMLVSIDSEIMWVTSKAGNLLGVTRGFDGTSAAVHAKGATVYAFIDAWHHNSIADEVKAVETSLYHVTYNGAGFGVSEASADAELILRTTGAMTTGYAQHAHFKKVEAEWWAGTRSTAPNLGFGVGRTIYKEDLVIDENGLLWTGPGNYIASETGASNAIVATAGPVLAAGLRLAVKLAHTLQAGANTFAYKGGSALAIKSHRNPANDIGVAYAVGGIIELVYDGTVWQDMSQ